MTMKFQCPQEDCGKEMTLAEDQHVCPSEDCGHTLSIDEATQAFEEGTIVGLVDESEVNDFEDVIAADLSEDMKVLVESLELSDDLAEKAQTIMESAITSQVKTQVAVIEEKAEAYVEYMKEEIETELVDKVDSYLALVVSEWVEENKLEIDAGIKSEMDESFIEGLADLLKEHYIQAPDQRWDIVEGLAQKVEELETKLDESMDATIEAKNDVQEATKAISVLRLSEGLVETQKEKLLELAESIEDESAEVFSSKLKTLKESYFDAKQTKVISEDLIEDETLTTSVGSKSQMAEVMRLLARK